MIKVCLIYRKNILNGRPSIENVFNTISKSLPKDQILIEEFNCSSSLFETVWRLRKVKADIFHITGPNNFIAFFIPFRKKVVTIHDVYHWKFDLKGLRKFIFGLIYYYFPIRLCQCITVISDEVKRDVNKYFKSSDKNVFLIENPLSQNIAFVKKEYNNTAPVILQIGGSPHKNLENLIEAVKGINCFIEIVGKPSDEVISKMKNYNIDFNIEWNLSFHELQQKYNNCDIVFFASIYEGFGLPLLEAQSAGRPLIASNISPMKEIVGKGAILVDPLKPEEIRAAILKINSSSSFRQELVQSGFENLKNYQPSTIADKYLSIYKSV